MIKRIITNILFIGCMVVLFSIFSSCTMQSLDYIDSVKVGIFEIQYEDMQTLKEKDDISEVIIRYMIIDIFADSNVVYFLSIGKNKEDPSDELINRFKQDKFIIKKISDNSTYNDTGSQRVYLYIKGYKRNIFNVNEMEVFYTEDTNDYEYDYHLDIVLSISHKGNNWVVTKVITIRNIGPM